MELSCKKYPWIIGVLATALLSSCSFCKLREAQDVVAQADSLWAAGQMYGREAGDSATLAQAYKTLEAIPLPFREGLGLGSPFAHACYHYGRLLRERENPAAAMEAFIHATHSRTHDYHILGRVYSNMGSICHLASEFPLAYDMYERSANCFLKNGDTLNYYYALNDMAYELAEQSKEKETLSLLDSIAIQSTTIYLKTKILETRITLNKHLHRYDIVLAYADSLISLNYYEPFVFISKAQSFCHLNLYDSAVYYAKKTIEFSNDLFNLDNSYYILIHCDSINNGNQVYTLSSDRADVKKLLAIRQGKLSQAVQLLEQDLNRKPDLRWLYAILVTLILVGTGIGCYVSRKRKKQRLLIQQIDVLEQTASVMQEKHDEMKEQRKQKILANCELFAESNEIRNLLHKGDYNKVCELINVHFLMFADKLKKMGSMNEKDICLCIFVMTGSLTDNQIADMLYYSHKTIRSTKRHVAKKLGTTSAQFQYFLLEKAIE